MATLIASHTVREPDGSLRKVQDIWSLDDESASSNSDIIDTSGAKSVQFFGDVGITVRLPNTNASGVYITAASTLYTAGVVDATASLGGSISGDTMPARVIFALAASFTAGRVFINY